MQDLDNISVNCDNKNFSSFEGVLFNKNNTLVRCPEGRAGEYSIPQGTLGIGSKAFRNCKNLNSIIIAESVTDICIFAFQNCSKLESIVLPSAVKKIEKFAFSNCNNLHTIIIKNLTQVLEIDFFSSSLPMGTKIYVPNHLLSAYKQRQSGSCIFKRISDLP